MGAFILRRLAHGCIVVCGVTIIVFIVTRLIGDPVSVMLPMGTTEERAMLSAQLGFDQPIVNQFATFVKGAATLDFGQSVWQRRPVFGIIFERIPATLILTFTAMALAIILAVPLGIFGALRPGSLSDRLTVVLSLICLSVPQFWLGLLFILVFSVQLGWLPTSGYRGPASIVLPALTLALPAMTRLLMVVRSSIMDELNQQYVKTAKAKGLPFIRIVGVHALRNGAVTFTNLAGWELIRALAGYTIIVESVFSWPGLGQTAIQSIQKGDLILLQAIVFTIAIMVVVVTALLDILQKIIDPRVRLA